MAQLAVAPDTLDALITSLHTELATLRLMPVAVTAKVPNPRPERLVRLTRVGGPATSRIVDTPLLLLEAWAPTEKETQELLNDARALVLRTGRHMPGLFVRRAAEVGGPSMDPDPDTDSPRWRCTVELTVRMTTREV